MNLSIDPCVREYWIFISFAVDSALDRCRHYCAKYNSTQVNPEVWLLPLKLTLIFNLMQQNVLVWESTSKQTDSPHKKVRAYDRCRQHNRLVPPNYRNYCEHWCARDLNTPNQNQHIILHNWVDQHSNHITTPASHKSSANSWYSSE